MTDFTHFIFVDFENVQDVDIALVQDKAVHVTLLIGAKQTKMSMDLAIQLPTYAAQVRSIKVGGSGRNALDLTLAMYLGREIERHPQANFVIVSRDRDFDPMIAHLQAAKAKVTRTATFSAVPLFARPKKAPSSKPAATATPQPTPPRKSAPTPTPVRIPADHTSDLARRQNALLARLGNPTNKNRPSTQKALAAYIRATLGNDISETDVVATLQLLESRGLLSIDAQKKVVYGG